MSITLTWQAHLVHLARDVLPLCPTLPLFRPKRRGSPECLCSSAECCRPQGVFKHFVLQPSTATPIFLHNRHRERHCCSSNSSTQSNPIFVITCDLLISLVAFQWPIIFHTVYSQISHSFNHHSCYVTQQVPTVSKQIFTKMPRHDLRRPHSLS